jgi:hypothetical protein
LDIKEKKIKGKYLSELRMCRCYSHASPSR